MEIIQPFFRKKKKLTFIFEIVNYLAYKAKTIGMTNQG